MTRSWTPPQHVRFGAILAVVALLSTTTLLPVASADHEHCDGNAIEPTACFVGGVVDDVDCTQYYWKESSNATDVGSSPKVNRSDGPPGSSNLTERDGLVDTDASPTLAIAAIGLALTAIMFADWAYHEWFEEDEYDSELRCIGDVELDGECGGGVHRTCHLEAKRHTDEDYESEASCYYDGVTEESCEADVVENDVLLDARKPPIKDGLIRHFYTAKVCTSWSAQVTNRFEEPARPIHALDAEDETSIDVCSEEVEVDFVEDTPPATDAIDHASDPWTPGDL